MSECVWVIVEPCNDMLTRPRCNSRSNTNRTVEHRQKKHWNKLLIHKVYIYVIHNVHLTICNNFHTLNSNAYQCKHHYDNKCIVVFNINCYNNVWMLSRNYTMNFRELVYVCIFLIRIFGSLGSIDLELNFWNSFFYSYFWYKAHSRIYNV